MWVTVTCVDADPRVSKYRRVGHTRVVWVAWGNNGKKIVRLEGTGDDLLGRVVF